MDFVALVQGIRAAHEHFAAAAMRSVNIGLTLRNWLIGYRILTYEQDGSDRAAYGEGLLDALAERLQAEGLDRVDSRELRRYRRFCEAYPQIRGTVSPELLGQTGSGRQLGPPVASGDATARAVIRETVSPGSGLSVGRLLGGLSFSHFAELLGIDDPAQRAFYEEECIRGQWSVRELRRQISSLLYERTGLSKDKDGLAELVCRDAEPSSPALAIRDPYVFEFLGLKPREVMSESHLEDSLLDRVQEFLLELGRGFCFEARQKRILIGDELFFVDLVFYHRILKCHVLIELKVDEFRHEHLGQLNTYVNWFRRHEMADSDNPPVGMLLCTRRNTALLEYALAGMDNALFVSRYQLELPRKEDLERLLEAELRQQGVP